MYTLNSQPRKYLEGKLTEGSRIRGAGWAAFSDEDRTQPPDDDFGVWILSACLTCRRGRSLLGGSGEAEAPGSVLRRRRISNDSLRDSGWWGPWRTFDSGGWVLNGTQGWILQRGKKVDSLPRCDVSPGTHNIRSSAGNLHPTCLTPGYPTEPRSFPAKKPPKRVQEGKPRGAPGRDKGRTELRGARLDLASSSPSRRPRSQPTPWTRRIRVYSCMWGEDARTVRTCTLCKGRSPLGCSHLRPCHSPPPAILLRVFSGKGWGVPHLR